MLALCPKSNTKPPTPSTSIQTDPTHNRCGRRGALEALVSGTLIAKTPLPSTRWRTPIARSLAAPSQHGEHLRVRGCPQLAQSLLPASPQHSPPHPVHIGSDSRSFVRKGSDLIERGLVTPARPWEMQPDGDLWKLFQRTCTQRGAKSLRLTWDKGHVQDQQVQEGLFCGEHKDGNDRADALADKGVGMHDESLCVLSQVWAKRHRAYARFAQQLMVFTTQNAACGSVCEGKGGEDRRTNWPHPPACLHSNSACV